MANVLKMMMVEAIHSLRSAGLSCREIARRLGIHRETVSRHRRGQLRQRAAAAQEARGRSSRAVPADGEPAGIRGPGGLRHGCSGHRARCPPVAASPRLPTLPIASAVTAFRSRWYGANTPGLFQGGRRYRCFRGGGTRSASRYKNSNGVNSTTPLAPGRVDFRPRPGPTQLVALCLGSTERTRAMRPSGLRITDSRSNAKGGRAQYRSRCSRG